MCTIIEFKVHFRFVPMDNLDKHLKMPKPEKFDFDGAWKRAIEFYFERFMNFCFPNETKLIDWSKDFQFLDKELQKITRNSQTGKRHVDKLVKVTLINGEEEWLLIHVEVQNQKDASFPDRMLIYNTRGRDHFGVDVMSLAVLTDEDETWKPCRFVKKIGAFQLLLEYPVCKMQDYKSKLSELEQSANPIEIFVAAHLQTQASREDPQKLNNKKWQLTRGLYKKGLSKQEIIDIFILIDWLMVLPEAMEETFKDKLLQFEQEQEMPYITSIERIGRREGQNEGILIGEIRICQELLGQEPSSTEALLKLSKEELQARHDQLREEIHQKPGS